MARVADGPARCAMVSGTACGALCGSTVSRRDCMDQSREPHRWLAQSNGWRDVIRHLLDDRHDLGARPLLLHVCLPQLLVGVAEHRSQSRGCGANEWCGTSYSAADDYVASGLASDSGGCVSRICG